MYPNIDSVGLSNMQLILYSKFWAATVNIHIRTNAIEVIQIEGLPSGLRRRDQFLPLYVAISPHAPATLELTSNAFHSR